MFYHDPHLGDGETKAVKPLLRLFQHAGSCQWIQNPHLSVSGLSFFICKTTSQGCCEVESWRKCSRNGSSCCHSFSALWNEVLRSLLDSPLCQHSPALFGVGDFLEPQKGARSSMKSNPSAILGPRCLLLAPRKEVMFGMQTKYRTWPKSKGCLQMG